MRLSRRVAAIGAIGFGLLVGLDNEPSATPLKSEEVEVINSRQLVRNILDAQSKMALGDPSALSYHATAQLKAELEFSKIIKSTKTYSGVIRDILTYTLIGGNPNILREVDMRLIALESDRHLARAVLSWREGTAKSIDSSLWPRDGLDSDPMFSAALSNATSAKLSDTETKLALGNLKSVRLLAPGTLMEENALRRQILLNFGQNNNEAVRLLKVYARRFGSSPYNSSLAEKISIHILTNLTKDSLPELLSLFESTEPVEMRVLVNVLLQTARDALRRGQLGLASSLISSLSAKRELTAIEMARMKIYAQAAVPLSPIDLDWNQYIDAIAADKIDPVDARLLSTVRDIATQKSNFSVDPTGSASSSIRSAMSLERVDASISKSRNILAAAKNALKMVNQ